MREEVGGSEGEGVLVEFNVGSEGESDGEGEEGAEALPESFVRRMLGCERQEDAAVELAERGWWEEELGGLCSHWARFVGGEGFGSFRDFAVKEGVRWGLGEEWVAFLQDSPMGLRSFQRVTVTEARDLMSGGRRRYGWGGDYEIGKEVEEARGVLCRWRPLPSARIMRWVFYEFEAARAYIEHVARYGEGVFSRLLDGEGEEEDDGSLGSGYGD